MTTLQAKTTRELIVSQDEARRIHGQKIIVRDNRLNEAFENFTADEGKLLYFALAQFKTKLNPEGKFSKEVGEVVIHAEEMAAFYGMDRNSAYNQISLAVDGLMSKKIQVPEYETGKPIRTLYVHFCEYMKREAKVRFGISEKLKPYIEDVQQAFTKISLQDTIMLKRRHSRRLYSLLMQYNNKNRESHWREDSLEELKYYFGLVDLDEEGNIIAFHYPRWADFKKRVIEPAIEEIVQNTDFVITYSTIKKGRKIQKIRFDFYEQKNLFR